MHAHQRVAGHSRATSSIPHGVGREMGLKPLFPSGKRGQCKGLARLQTWAQCARDDGYGAWLEGKAPAVDGHGVWFEGS